MRQYHLGRHHVRGFALIELLVVVVIIAILATIIIPRLTGGGSGGVDPFTKEKRPKSASPRERAQQTMSVEYIGQINQAIQMYKMDHDDELPPNLDALRTYGLTAEMIRDPRTGQPLTYNPQTGQVGNSWGVSNGPYSLGGGQTLPQVGN